MKKLNANLQAILQKSRNLKANLRFNKINKSSSVASKIAAMHNVQRASGRRGN